MARYIDANDVKDLLIGLESLPWEDEVDDLIKVLPTADVAEVRHGIWIEGAEHFTNGFYEAECSVCGNYIRWNEGNSGEWNFCPNCGAKMDGKGESDETD